MLDPPFRRRKEVDVGHLDLICQLCVSPTLNCVEILVQQEQFPVTLSDFWGSNFWGSNFWGSDTGMEMVYCG